MVKQTVCRMVFSLIVVHCYGMYTLQGMGSDRILLLEKHRQKKKLDNVRSTSVLLGGMCFGGHAVRKPPLPVFISLSKKEQECIELLKILNAEPEDVGTGFDKRLKK